MLTFVTIVHPTFEDMKGKIITISLRILTGLLFIASAFLKLYPAEILEVAIVETRLIGWTLAPFAARLLIGFEFFLGVMLITGLFSNFVTQLSIVTLTGFTFYLAILLAVQGNSSNCNCFGMAFEMTPVESIIKNACLLLILLYLFKKQTPFKWRFSLLSTILIGIASIGAAFALAPIIVGGYKPSPDELNVRMELELVYEDPEAEIPSVELREGKWIAVFLSATCRHCIVAGYKLHVIKSKNPEIPIYILINGELDKIERFHYLTKSKNIPYSEIDRLALLQLVGTRLPSIIWLEDGVVVNKTTIYGISEKSILEWLND